MFNSEQFPIDTSFVTLSPSLPIAGLLEGLRQSGAACIEAEASLFLFTSGDLPLLEDTPDLPVEEFLKTRPELASTVWIVDEAQTGPDALHDTPAFGSRPVVIRSRSGAVLGYSLPADLIDFLLKSSRQYASYFYSLAETVADAVTVVDRSGKVICWNTPAEEVYGIPKSDIIGRRIGEHFDADSLIIMKILDEGRRIRSTYHRPRPGTHVLINASPILDKDGRIIGGIATEQDITNLVRLNEELSTAGSGRLEVNPDQGDPFAAISGKGEAVGKAIGLARKVAAADNPLLIVGETGVGKEQLAITIHGASRRASAPCLAVNCGAVPAGLLDTELFGYQGGAFTGHAAGSAGKIELADGGTLFIDEIDKLPLDTQAKLYHYMQNRTVVRSGGHAPVAVSTRIIAAAKQDLLPLVERGDFRADLYYALNVITIALPPLRERKEDIPGIIQLYLREYALQYQKPLPHIAPEVMLALMNYDWPGNIRELKNIIERCVILSEDDRITHEHLPKQIQDEQPLDAEFFEGTTVRRDKVLRTNISENEELHLIREALAKTLGNKSAAAKLLGVSRGTLYNKLKEYQLD
ncbi:transcriptional regulator [Paenibacillus mucilaginosus 3016]|uniref:Transcriptional regulator n=1 Tax=Paenibacillus mucilaginosus 3016 TaxID=1116391 RepID=H6NE95_9BACL|nr:sigma-54-dependent Fis family transcriptional regulator [Paenibacillus mucilaginosus]AFC33871.1 transcriptional regulator [Paenibacillus mucilaginosus 3016]WFA22250.1 sigma-54-dependent Fis family transcriptional regulator [Paenibacillus mucilaginosus]